GLMARFMVQPRFLCAACVEGSPHPVHGRYLGVLRKVMLKPRRKLPQIEMVRRLEGLDLRRGFDRNVGRVLRVLAVFPVDGLVEFIKVELPTLAALEQIAPPVAFIHIKLDQLKALVLWTLRTLRLGPENALGRGLHAAAFVTQCNGSLG